MIKFTKEEKIAIIFVLAALFAGLTAFYCKKTIPRACKIFGFDEKRIKAIEKININSAGREELVKLKRIGPVMAGRIISYREEYGPFQRKEDLKDVKGIGEKTYEKMKGQIVLE